MTRRDPTQALPRPVFCVIGHARRDRRLADAVRRGRFTHAGSTLTLGMPPDWNATSLPDDEEWAIEWRKFYYGLDLAHAFGETRDQGYLDAWETLVLSFADGARLDDDTSDVIGRRVQNWIYAWRRLAESPGFPGLRAGAADRILESLAEQLERVRRGLSVERNHRTLELYALLVGALAFPKLDPDGSLREFSVRELHLNLMRDVLPDGTHRELSTHYHMMVLRTFLGMRENAQRFGLALQQGFDARVERACEFALHCHAPDGGIPALSDADTGSYRDLLALAARHFGRDDFLYAATGGEAGEPPAATSAHFPDGGYDFQRSHWAAGAHGRGDARYLVFDCGALGAGGHGHYDALSIEVHAGGRRLLVDPGRFTYDESPPNWRRWFKGTAAHNTVCVDGRDQTPYRRGKPRGPVARARLLSRLAAPGLSLLHGEVRSPAYDAIHRRRVAFVAGEYWILEDRLEATQPHRYDLRFHLAPEAWGRTRVEAGAAGWRVHAPGLVLECHGERVPSLEDGWVAPEYGVRQAAPVVSLVSERARDDAFLTLVAPRETGAPAPALCGVERSPSGRVRMVVGGLGSDGRSRDCVTWCDAPEEMRCGPWRFRARAARWREDASGFLLEWDASGVAAFGGTRTGGARSLHWSRERGLRVLTDGETPS